VTSALLVALGAAVGAPLRYLADRAVQRRVPGPWGTVTVNVAGSFVLGLLAAAANGGTVQLLVGTGFCGALTTYSTFAYETVRRAGTGETVRAAVEALAGIAAGLLAAALGLALAG
jgi:CrcB protein